jgi:hypothetical protein
MGVFLIVKKGEGRGGSTDIDEVGIKKNKKNSALYSILHIQREITQVIIMNFLFSHVCYIYRI